MQALFIIFLQLGIGGVQRKIIDIVNYLGEKKPELPIYILLRNRTKFDMGLDIKNRNVHIINYAEWIKAKVPFRVRFFFPFFVLYQVWSKNPSSILAFLDFCSLPAILAKKLLFWRKIKVVLSEDHYASGVISVQTWGKFRHLLISSFYPAADMIFTCSKANKKDLVEYYGLPGRKVKVLLNWTNFIDKRPTRVKKIYDLIYVGRFEKTKNLEFLLLAIKKIKEEEKKKVSLCLLGEGKERESLKKLAGELNIEKQVFFVETKHNVENMMVKAKILVYASWFKVEGLPLAILESMALGIPVLTRNFAGAKEFLIDKGNCYIFNNEKEFIQTVTKLLESNRERSLIADKAKKYVTKHHSSENIDGYLEELGVVSSSD